MVNIIIGIIILMLVVFVILRMMPVKGVSQIDANELKEKLKKKKEYQFIDVRTPSEV